MLTLYTMLSRSTIPSTLVRDPEISFTQPSQVIGTENVVYAVLVGETPIAAIQPCTQETDLEGFNHDE